jgi:DnaJ-class molecular chaperone
MDIDGFDPYEDEYDWRDRLETMGEAFQEALKAKGIKRRLIHPKERTRKPPATASDHLEQVLDELQPKCNTCGGNGFMYEKRMSDRCVMATPCPDCRGLRELPTVFKFVGCPACSGAGGGLVSNGDWDECGDCRGTGEIPNPERQTFKFTGF